MSKPKTTSSSPLIAHLQECVQRRDAGALADLRSGLGKAPGTASRMFPHVVPYLGGVHEAHEQWYYLVATLFAQWHQSQLGKEEGQETPLNSQGREAKSRRNFGESLAELVADNPDQSKSLDRRVVALLNSHPDDLPVHLRHMVSLLRGQRVSIDWQVLLADLPRWGYDDRPVQRAWARSYWRDRAETEGSEASQPDDEPPSEEEEADAEEAD
jgi:CRISPR system Cascade subunit CasB